MTEKNLFSIRPVTASDQSGLSRFMKKHWGDVTVVVHGHVYYPENLPGFVAVNNGKWIGLITYHVANDNCEIVTLNSLREREGIGSKLLKCAENMARSQNCQRLWLVTTNDNLNALRFYQKRGFELVAVHRQAIASSRLIKPQIPLIGQHGIPIRDEIELELRLVR